MVRDLKQVAIAVIGAGTMGAGIAFVAAQHGHSVVLIDSTADGLKRGEALVAGMVEAAIRKGLVDAGMQACLTSLVAYDLDIGAIRQADLVIEAIIEDSDAKAALIRAACARMKPEAVFVSNTSSLSVAQLATHCPWPERFAGLHFFNPVPAMKLVELIPAPATAPSVVEGLADLMKAWSKVPVRARDVSGFIVNNVARPYYGEAFLALADGMMPRAIDDLLCHAGGFRMGALALTDLIGQDVNYAVAQSVFAGRKGRARFRLSQVQSDLVARGWLGRKSGRGFYNYGQDEAPNSFALPLVKAGQLSAAGELDCLAPLVSRILQTGVGVEVDRSLARDTLCLDGVRFATGDGRTLASRDDVEVLVDWARDWASATAVGVTAKSPKGIEASQRLGALAGMRVYEVPDRAGQLVLRTLVQLANAGADALVERVASPEDIDTAMQLGANHPEGPLSWALRAGSGWVEQVLANLAHATADEIYTPSGGLRMLGSGNE